MSQGNSDRVLPNSASERNANNGSDHESQPRPFIASASREHAAWRLGRVLNELRYRLGGNRLQDSIDRSAYTESLWYELQSLVREIALERSIQNDAEDLVRDAHLIWRADWESEWFAEAIIGERQHLLSQGGGDSPSPTDDLLDRLLETVRKETDRVERLRMALWELLPAEILPFARLGLHTDQVLHPEITAEAIEFTWLYRDVHGGVTDYSLDAGDGTTGAQADAPSWQNRADLHPPNPRNRPNEIQLRPRRNRSWDLWRREHNHLRRQVGLSEEFPVASEPNAAIVYFEREICQLTAPGPESQPLALQLGLCIDRQRRTVTRQGRAIPPVRLAPRHLSLLEHFLQAGNEPTEIEWLCRNWERFGRRSPAQPNTVDDAISSFNRRVENLEIEIMPLNVGQRVLRSMTSGGH